MKELERQYKEGNYYLLDNLIDNGYFDYFSKKELMNLLFEYNWFIKDKLLNILKKVQTSKKYLKKLLEAFYKFDSLTAKEIDKYIIILLTGNNFDKGIIKYLKKEILEHFRFYHEKNIKCLFTKN